MLIDLKHFLVMEPLDEHQLRLQVEQQVRVHDQRAVLERAIPPQLLFFVLDLDYARVVEFPSSEPPTILE